MRLSIYLILVLISSRFQAGAQNLFFNFTDTVPVVINGAVLASAWAGGQNFVSVSSTDMNNDGFRDLLVFDRSGNKTSAYLNMGIADSVSYRYSHFYSKRFPKLRSWALLRDYNCDGKEDIFTSTPAGMKIYRNTSQGADLSFVLAEDLVYAYYLNNPPANFYNLSVTPVDIPAILDVDDDGDLDVLTFDFTGVRINLFKNHSLEWHNTCDSLSAFVLVDECWGNFTENFSNNSVTLSDCPPQMPPAEEGDPRDSRHAGSCTMCADLNGDGFKDLVLGDISFPDLTALYNSGGNLNDSHIASQDSTFPVYDFPVEAALYPCGFYEDLNNDNVRDFIASPNAAACSLNNTSIWYYENVRQDDSARFAFRTNSLLQRDMIEVGEGAYPAFTDYNQDGKMDLVVGNYGTMSAGCNLVSKLTLFQNTGTSLDPSFQLITRDWQGLGNLALAALRPAFGDLDGDGDDDMVVGEENGRMYYYQNIAATGTAANYVLGPSIFNGIDVGLLAAPQIVDLNNDGLLDVVAGESNGNLNYFQNNGSAASPSFSSTPTTDSLGKVVVTGPSSLVGASMPWFFRVNGEWNLFVGSADGYVSHYDQISNNLNGSFHLVSASVMDIYEGSRTSPAVRDFNADGYPDLILGNYAGGLSWYSGDPSASVASRPAASIRHLRPIPNPANEVIYVDLRGLSDSSVQWSVLDASGKKILSGETAPAEQVGIRVEPLPSGLYFLLIRGNQQSASGKFIVSHEP